MIEEAKNVVSDWSADQWDAIKGDGCTGIPDMYLETPCERHDRHYATHRHRDGTPITRFEADWELAKDAWKSMPVVPPEKKFTLLNAAPLSLVCLMRAVVKVVVPPIVFSGVRLFGKPHWEL